MESYKERMTKEYYDLKEKRDKLHNMLVKYKANTLDFTPTCPYEILAEQEDVMSHYLTILEVRAQMEDIPLL